MKGGIIAFAFWRKQHKYLKLKKGTIISRTKANKAHWTTGHVSTVHQQTSS